MEFVESFEFVDDGERRHEELAVGFVEQMRDEEAVELAYAAAVIGYCETIFGSRHLVMMTRSIDWPCTLWTVMALVGTSGNCESLTVRLLLSLVVRVFLTGSTGNTFGGHNRRPLRVR